MKFLQGTHLAEANEQFELSLWETLQTSTQFEREAASLRRIEAGDLKSACSVLNSMTAHLTLLKSMFSHLSPQLEALSSATFEAVYPESKEPEEPEAPKGPARPVQAESELTKRWAAEILSDPVRDYQLYVELLQDEEYAAKVYRDDAGHLMLGIYPREETLTIPIKWLRELVERAEVDLPVEPDE